MQIVFQIGNLLKIEPSPTLAKIVFSIIVNGLILSGYLSIIIVRKFFKNLYLSKFI